MPEEKKAKVKWTPNAEQRELLESLKAEQDKYPSAAEFVRKNVATFGEAKWSRIMAVLDGDKPDRLSYFDMVEDPLVVIDQLEGIERELRSEQVREKVD